MSIYIHESLEAWTLPRTRTRTRSKFASTMTQTLDLLARELRHLNARDARLKTLHGSYDVRRDGLLRSDARTPLHPGVILTFESNGNSMTFPCDRFLDWRDNLRAIALSLEALRMVDRYGVTTHGEQYKGFKSLPPAPGIVLLSRAQAIKFLAQHSNIVLDTHSSDQESIVRAYKIAAKHLHPDASGDPELWLTLQTAKQILGF